MKAFHNAPGWAQRAQIAATFQDERLQHLATRLLWAHGRQAMDPDYAARIDLAVLANRLTATDEKLPWTTLSKAMGELALLKDGPLRPMIASWYETLAAEIAGGRLPAG